MNRSTSFSNGIHSGGGYDRGGSNGGVGMAGGSGGGRGRGRQGRSGMNGRREGVLIKSEKYPLCAPS